jgi:methylmalonyl-CoA/ethylmalonyl-CoA epimerase
MRINHIGYLVKNIEKARAVFEGLGYTVSRLDMGCDVVYDGYRDVDLCFMEKDGYRIELVSPKSRDSVVYGLLKKFGNNAYHICYETDDIENEVDRLRGKRFVQSGETRPAVAFGGRRVCFMVNSVIGMIELLETGDSPALRK